MDTPVIQLSERDRETVYEPSEDSFLLIDALEADLETLKILKPRVCLEIGSGSGVVITALASALSKWCKSYYVAIDINPDACKVTKKTSIVNSTDVDAIQMDLVDGICTKDIFDIVIFNPPYVVTESSEVYDEKLITRTWAGGSKGRQVMERLFVHIPKILSETGFFYLVAIKENDPEYIVKAFRNLNMKGKVVAERKVRGEHLYVLRFVKV